MGEGRRRGEHLNAGQHEVAYKGLGDAFLECDLHDAATWESEAFRGNQR